MKRKAIVLLVSLCLLLCGCANGDVSQTSSITEEEQCLNTAKALLEQDNAAVSLIIGGGLWEQAKESITSVSNVDYFGIPVTEGEYASFTAVEKLLSETYAQAGQTAGTLLNYPGKGTRAVYSKDGVTYATGNYINSGFIDAILPETASVSKVSDRQYSITAQTESGKSITCNMVLEDNIWLLENSVALQIDDEYLNDVPKTAYSGLGSANNLSGKILAVCMFVSDNESTINDKEASAFFQKIKQSNDFLEQQAEEYGTELSIDEKSLFYIHQGFLDSSNAFGFDLMLAKTTYETAQGYIEANADVSEYDGYFLAVFCNKEGELYCEAYTNREESQLDVSVTGAVVSETERMFIYANTTSADICRKTLNIFGAFSIETNDYQTLLLNDLCENEILQCSESDMSKLSLSGITAYNSGMIRNISFLYSGFYK